MQAHESAGKASTLKPLAKIPTQVQAKLDANLALMEELGLSATPAIFYLDDKGQLQTQQGAPRPEMLGKILGKR
ncbi:Thiol:disulfide interchange protein DsbG precursor [compost metagenome]